MAGRKLTALTSLGAKPELDDEFYLVDTSDTSESPQGTSKKITGENLAKLGGFQPVNNLQAGSAPTITDDSSDGYSEGSLWGFGDNLYKCTDASVGAAVWVQLQSSQVDKTFVPTVSDLSGGTFSISNFLITELSGVVEFSFAGRFDLAAATTSGNCKIDLPSAFQPASNWSSQTDVVCTISRTNGIITAETKITADDSGSKLISIQAGDTIPEASVRFSAIGRYKRS